MHIVDHRLNASGKSLPNRQRFLRRVRGEVQKAVHDISRDRQIRNLEAEAEVTIPTDGISESSFRRKPHSGKRNIVLPGNRHYVEGDTIPRPQSGDGGSGSEGSPDGSGEDSFRFVLTKDEFLDMFLEDLELPDPSKRRVAMIVADTPRRAGYSMDGSPSRLAIARTMRNALSRRIALNRPTDADKKVLEDEIEALAETGDDPERLIMLRAEYDTMINRTLRIYFLEKTAPRLQPWQREILRIVRLIAQYFYPQRQTKVMNEGCATYCHYKILTHLHEQGQISDGSFLEILQSHTNVIAQPGFDSPAFSGFNPYALGFAMMQDIERICTDPTDEDREWFPEIVGDGKGMETLRDIWANYRDESFISQFFSPSLMRKLRLFQIGDEPSEPEISVEAIHDESDYRKLRRSLARQYDVGWQDPDIKIVNVDLSGDRHLILQYQTLQGATLEETSARTVLQHLADLWGYDVVLREVSSASDTGIAEHKAQSRPVFF